MKTNSKIIEKIIQKTENPEIIEQLTNKISLPELQSLLLSVYKTKTESLSPKYLFEQYKNNRFAKPSSIPPEKFIQLEQLIYSVLPKDVKNIDLSPVAPLGASSIVGPVNQNNVISTIRNNEVLADPTNVLALEAAKIRENTDKKQDTKLYTSARVTRTQLFEGKGSVAHFKIMSLCNAGRDKGSFRFETENLKNHFAFYIDFFHALSRLNIEVNKIRILLIIFDINFESKLNELLEELCIIYPEINFQVKHYEEEQSYYKTIRYNIFASNNKDEEYFLCDGGFTDWTQKILNNKKERFLISGLGTERLFLVF